MTDRQLNEYKKRRGKYSEIIDWLVRGMDIPEIMALCKFRGIKIGKSTIYNLKKEYLNGKMRYGL